MAFFVLVHGAWHGPWCWQLLERELGVRGHSSVAVDLRGDDRSVGLEENLQVVLDAAAERDDVVLVGHSLGGIVLPLVVERRPVRRLSFVCGLIPRPGRSINDVLVEEDLLASNPDRAAIRHPDGSSSWEQEAAVRSYFHDCDRSTAEWAASRLRRQTWTTSREPCPLHHWPEVECQYILCSGDKVVRPAWSRRRAREWLGTEALELPGGHDPMLSRPRELADLLVLGL